MKHKLWDLFWKLPHKVRVVLCVYKKKHIGKSWLGIETIKKNGDGFCSICGSGAYAEPHLSP